MGWTFTHRERGITTREFFQREMSGYEILASAVVDGVFYAATRDRASNQVDGFIALIQWGKSYHNFGYKDMDERMGPNEAKAPARVLDLLTPLPECSHDGNWCVYCGSEIRQDAQGEWVYDARPGQVPECGGRRCYSGYPVSARQADGSAPSHAAGGTPPCGTCWARAWRQACRTHAGRLAFAKGIKPGQSVKFARTFEFRNGHQDDTFEVLGEDRFRGRDGLIYRIPGWPALKLDLVSGVK